MRNEAINEYLTKKYSLRRGIYHFLYGLIVIKRNPLVFFGLMVLISGGVVFGGLWILKAIDGFLIISPEAISKVVICLETVLIIFFIFLFVWAVGDTKAKRYEGMLYACFDVKMLKAGLPILRDCVIDKKRNYRIFTFYTSIPKHLWEERMSYIADVFDARFIGEKIAYGGKKKSGNHIVLFLADGRVPDERGDIIEEGL